MTQFLRYDSIENSYRTKYVEKCKASVSRGKCEDDFVVEEKAHGANFSFYYDGSEMRTASRNDFLEGDGHLFCKSHIVKEKCQGLIKELYAAIGDGKPIRVVGEIIGGVYTHPDVESDPRVPRVQKGVDYCPSLEFYAFDISIWDNTKGKYLFMDKLAANTLFERVGLLYAKPLFRGSLQECLEYDNTFKSHIPGWMGLPDHPGKNLAEGKVIKPVKYASLVNRATLVLKDKTESFSEVSKAPKEKPKNQSRPAIVLSAPGKDLLETLCSYITENRLRNVLSKLQCSPKQKDFRRLVALFLKDAFEDFKKDHVAKFSMLQREMVGIKNDFEDLAMEFVKPRFAIIVSGEF